MPILYPHRLINSLDINSGGTNAPEENIKSVCVCVFFNNLNFENPFEKYLTTILILRDTFC